MNIAILGTRGIPAAYGGFETLAEELSTRLVRRGHRVTVYCRAHAVARPPSGDTYQGVRLVFLPTVRHKYFDTVAHAFLSVLHALFQDEQVLLICNAANSVFSWMPRLAGQKTVVNVDGLERRRKKWNAAGRAWYRVSEWFSTFLPTAIVTDARTIQEYYRRRYHAESRFIAYGAAPVNGAGSGRVEALGLRPGGYVLYVSRLEPENNALLVVRAFQRLEGDVQLAVIGDAPYAREYIAQVRAAAGPRVVLPGAVYGDAYRELLANALLYVHATEVGGTHPALIEAMAAGRAVLFLDTPENREAAGGAGLPFPPEESALTAAMSRLIADPGERARLGSAAREQARQRFDWDAVTTEYERLFAELCRI
jgi:glycosyltransferase involved in cell wall biosynthesis